MTREELKRKVTQWHRDRAQRIATQMTPPRYDEVYYDGIRWLESLDEDQESEKN